MRQIIGNIKMVSIEWEQNGMNGLYDQKEYVLMIYDNYSYLNHS